MLIYIKSMKKLFELPHIEQLGKERGHILMHIEEKKGIQNQWLHTLQEETAALFVDHEPHYPSVVPMSQVQDYGFLRRIFQLLMDVCKLDPVYYPHATYLITDRNGIVVSTKQGETCNIYRFGKWGLRTVGLSAISMCIRSGHSALVCGTEHDAPFLQEFNSFAFPIIVHGETIGAFAFLVKPITSVDPFTSLLHFSTMVERTLLHCCQEDSQINLHQEINIERKYSGLIKEMHERLNVNQMLSKLAVELERILRKGNISIGLVGQKDRVLHLAWHSEGKKLPTLHLPIQQQNEETAELYQEIFIKQEFVTHNRARYQQLLKLFPGMEQLDFSSFILLPLSHKRELMGFILIHSKQYLMLQEDEQQLLSRLVKEIAASLHQALVHQEVEQAVHKRDILYHVSQKLYSTFNLNEVLKTIIESIDQLYPELHVDLYLTADTFEIEVPVKILQFSQQEQEIYLRAFMEGRVIHQEQTTGVSLAVPLLGKQGSYGVFHIYSEPGTYLAEDEVAFITLLAETAGHAFENAQLYQQSRELIRELKIVNQITQELNKKLQLNEVLVYLVKKMATTFNANSMIIHHNPDSSERYTIDAISSDELGQLTLEPLLDRLCQCLARGEGLIQSDESCPIRENYIVRSVMGIPIRTDGLTMQCLIVFSEKPFAFTYNDYQLLQLIAQHSSLAVNNAILHQRLEQMVITDQLTQLYARHYLNDQIVVSQERDGFGSFILIDIDDFKKVNDTYGHQKGDELLQFVAQTVKNSIREGDVAARWGGEEIAIYLPRCEISSAKQVAERIRQRVEATSQPKVTLSIGVTTWKHGERDLEGEELFYYADKAMYKAKNSGKNLVVVAD